MASGLVAFVYTERKLWSAGMLSDSGERVLPVTTDSKQEEKGDEEGWEAFDERRIDRGIDLATRYICNSVNSQGMFNYEVKVRYKSGEIEHKDSYNVLRHAGAIYSLVDSCYAKGSELYSDEQRALYCHDSLGKITETVDWLVRETVDVVPGVGLSAVYKPHRSHRKGNSTDRRLALGGQGLGMVAFAGANEVKPNEEKMVRLQILEEIGNFTMKVLQKDNGTFYPFYYPYKMPFGASNQPHSLYYPGEACLGLTYLYKAFKGEGNIEREIIMSGLYLEAAAKGLEGLANERETWPPETIPPDHWALIATAEILPFLPASRHDKLLKHAASVVKVMHDRDMVRIGYDAMLGVSSMATVLEAQFAMLPIFYERPSYYDNVEQAWCLAEKTAFLLRKVQERKKPDSMLGGLPHLIYLHNEDVSGSKEETETETEKEDIQRSITKDNGRFRIDDTQHTLSAWLSYKKALKTSGLANIDCTKVFIPGPVESLLRKEKPS